MAENVALKETTAEITGKTSTPPAGNDAASSAEAAPQVPVAKKEDYSTMPSKQLRGLRDSFVTALQPLQNNIKELDRYIAASEARETAEKNAAALAELVPEGFDAAALGGHEFVFLINKSKEGGHDTSDCFLVSAVMAANHMRKLSRIADEKNANVTGQFWGDKGAFLIPVKLGEESSYKEALTVAHNFVPAAKTILESSTPDKAAGKETHYVIIGEGKIDDSEENSVAILAAAAGLDPAATFDFVACSAEETAMEKLVEKLGATAAAKSVRLVKVNTPADISSAVVGALRARLEKKEETPTLPANPVQEEKQPVAPQPPQPPREPRPY